MHHKPIFTLFYLLLLLVVSGCFTKNTDHPLDPALARSSVETAMKAWVEGKTPADLQPKIIVGDPAWRAGQKLVSYEILANEESSDGSNLYISVVRKFSGKAAGQGSKVVYIVGTSPVVTIFPQ